MGKHEATIAEASVMLQSLSSAAEHAAGVLLYLQSCWCSCSGAAEHAAGVFLYCYSVGIRFVPTSFRWIVLACGLSSWPYRWKILNSSRIVVPPFLSIIIGVIASDRIACDRTRRLIRITLAFPAPPARFVDFP